MEITEKVLTWYCTECKYVMRLTDASARPRECPGCASEDVFPLIILTCEDCGLTATADVFFGSFGALEGRYDAGNIEPEEGEHIIFQCGHNDFRGRPLTIRNGTIVTINVPPGKSLGCGSANIAQYLAHEHT